MSLAMNQKQSVEHQFSSAAERYVVSPVHRGGPDLEALVAAAALEGHERILDLGCGPGHSLLPLAERAAELHGIDLSETMLGHARRLAEERGLGHVHFRRADAESLPYPDAHFDLVTSRQSAHHYPDPDAALAEVCRVLRPGGRFLLIDSVAPESPAANTLLNAVEVLRDPSHVRDHSVSEWQRRFEGAGLRPRHLGDWVLDIEIDPWAERMGTAAEAVAQLRRLLAGAGSDVRERLGVEGAPPERFRLDVMLLEGTRPSD